MTDPQKDNFKKDNNLAHARYNPALFGDNYNIYASYRRLENVASVLFLITNDFDQHNELKMSLRSLSLQAVSQVLSFITIHANNIHDVKKVLSTILELSSTISIAQWSGSISEMNATALHKELRKVEDTLAELITGVNQKLIIDQNLFAEVDLEARHFELMHPPKMSPVEKSNYLKSPQRSPLKTLKLQDQTMAEAGKSTKNERRDLIIKMLGERSNLNIKDFTAVIKDYSDKTIQRELLALVEEGVIKKQGERRWSTYSLAA
jgi:hypothetical protein